MAEGLVWLTVRKFWSSGLALVSDKSECLKANTLASRDGWRWSTCQKINSYEHQVAPKIYRVLPQEHDWRRPPDALTRRPRARFGEPRTAGALECGRAVHGQADRRKPVRPQARSS